MVHEFEPSTELSALSAESMLQILCLILSLPLTPALKNKETKENKKKNFLKGELLGGSVH